MMPKIIIDTDFLSSFIKIGKMEVIKEFYKAPSIYITQAVYTELSKTSLVKWVDKTPWIVLESIKLPELRNLFTESEYESIGEGERTAIALASRYKDSILLMNDNISRKIAVRNNIKTVDIPGFLFVCKKTSFLSNEEIQLIINDLK